ncbi:MAG: dihydroxy-acid dehydratase [Deltaproteobacteria bacterium]|nr:dihydroxy-acid dehydratase [Deltaproteobacteria bacterium]
MTNKKHELPDVFKDLAKNVIRPPLLYGCGRREDELKRPFVGIANTWTELNPGHVHLDKISAKVKEGITKAGLTAFEFNTIAPCDGMAEAHEGMRYILPAREIIAASIEIMAKVNLLDGLVLIGSCDKIVPGLLMAAARADIPAIVMPGGYALPYCYTSEAFPEEKEFAYPEIGKFVAAWQGGKISEKELQKVVQEIFTGPGACPELGTAMTMQCMAEALGMSLPYTAILPALSDQQFYFAFEIGERLSYMIENNITPSKIMTVDAFKNAISVLLSIGGSTNGFLHLPAIANELNIELPLEIFDELSEKTPQTCAIKPNGPRAINALQEAGGIPAVMKNLGRSLFLDVMGVNGKRLGDTLKSVSIYDREVIRPVNDPINPNGGLIVLKGNLSPRGSIVKKSAVQDKLHTFRGPAKIFESEEAAIGAMLDQEIEPGQCLVIRYEGPRGGPGMREMAFPGHILQIFGLGETCAMITDGRFSGTNYGLLVGHISPEAAEGGPLAIVRDGDIIEIDLRKKSLNADLSEGEIRQRLAKWKAPESKYKKGILSWYSKNVTSAHQGAVLKSGD